ncbi:MAG: RusA family crossover junction endodeoxyribonuclease [Clostridium sp.]|nr:RusA family crossover junction endodeoxyribonuclease [Clostridium sp.]MDU7084017.1 RusA family crossover junction endodeoxyribonuclease [Clostridium sp.]
MSEINYAKVIVKGSPISKSNFKLFNPITKRAILPSNTGQYHDRYAVYEEEIAYECSIQNPGVVLTEALIAVLKVYYKSEKRHPDTNNITKSILDGVEKSGLIINDAQVRRLIIEEFYDKNNPRFELELYGESSYAMDYKIVKLEEKQEPINYEPPSNKKNLGMNSKASEALKSKEIIEKTTNTSSKSQLEICDLCNKPIDRGNSMSCNGGKSHICKSCFKKLF